MSPHCRSCSAEFSLGHARTFRDQRLMNLIIAAETTLAPWVKDLGLPTAITAVVTVLAKSIADARRHRSKQTLLDWLARPAATEAFAGDERARNALSELRQTLIFERAFGLRTESKLRDQLLQFADERKDSMRLQEVLEAGRRLSRAAPAVLSEKSYMTHLRILRRMAKPLGYLYVILGYAGFFGGLWVSNALDWEGRLAIAATLLGFVFGGIFVSLGIIFFKQARRIEIIKDFIGWRLRSCPTTTLKGLQPPSD